MKKAPGVRAIVAQFPWGRVEKDGSFAAEIARARFDVLGGTDYGFWSQAAGLPPHHTAHQDPDGLAFKQKLMAAVAAATALPSNYQHGYQLLTNSLLNDEEGWKLTPDLIPRLKFDAAHSPPRLVSDVDIVDWRSWYDWRGIPKESPAALLLHYPLTVYQMLVHVLKVADPKAGTASSRRDIRLHYLGAEIELNFIPL